MPENERKDGFLRLESWLTPRLAGILLAVALAFQLFLLTWNVSQAVPRFIGDLDQPAWWRGAKIHQGRKFAQYLRFLRSNIPESGRVVLPPDQSSATKALATTPLMQFFLAPRPVVNCASPACLQGLSLQNNYVLVVGGFPGSQTLAQGRLQMFEPDWGLLSPASSQSIPSTQGEAPGGWAALSEVLLDLLWLAALAWAGARAVSLAFSDLPDPLRWSLGFGLGLAAFSMLLGSASLVGLPIRAATVAGAMLVVFGLRIPHVRGVMHSQPHKDSQPAGQDETRPVKRSFDPWPATFLVLGAVAALLALGQGYHASDELLLWGAKGYGIAQAGTLRSVTAWGTNTVPYPLNIPLLIAAARLLSSDLLPASKLVFPLYLTALVFLAYGSLQAAGARRSIAGMAALALGCSPLVFEHGTLAYANLPLAFYIVAGVVLLWLAGREASHSSPYGLFLLSGLMFACAAWTRPEGWVAAWLLGLVGGVLALWNRRKASFGPVTTGNVSVRSAFRSLIWLILPLALYGLFWAWLKSAVYAGAAGRTALVGQALDGLLHLNLHLSSLGYICRQFVRGNLAPEVWGYLSACAVVALIVALAKRRRATAAPLWAGGLLYLGLVIGLYYVTSFDTVHDISWWVNTGLDRMTMPGIVLLWLGGVAEAVIPMRLL